MERMPILSDTDMSLFKLKTRYVRNDLTYVGKNSKDFLLYISDPGVYDSPEVDMSLQQFPARTATSSRRMPKQESGGSRISTSAMMLSSSASCLRRRRR